MEIQGANSCLPSPGWENSQLRLELARRTTLLALAGITAAVATLTVTAVTTVTTTATAERPPLTLTLAAHHATRGRM